MPDCDGVVIDETHTGLGPNIYANLRKYMAASPKVVLGFTATPDYHHLKTTSSLLTHKIYGLPVTKAIESGQLAPLTVEDRELTVEIDEDRLSSDLKERATAITLAGLEAMLEDSLPEIRETIERQQGVLIRCPSGGDIAFAKFAAELLRNKLTRTSDRSGLRPIRAVAVGGSKQSATEVDLLLGGFRSGKVDVFTYVDLIGMGVDLPVAKLFLNLRLRSTSRVDMTQALGRVLRLQFDPLTQRPIPAMAINYVIPGSKTYRLRDVLEMKPGQVRITQIGPYQPQYNYPLAQAIELQSVAATVVTGEVDRVIVEHGSDVTYGNPDEKIISFDVACAYYGVPPAVMERWLIDVGYEGHPDLEQGDYGALADLIEAEAQSKEQPKPAPISVRSKPAPASTVPIEAPPAGHIAIEDTEAYGDWKGSRAAFISGLRRSGVPLLRVTDPVTRKGKFYIPKEYN